mmetsp:Transcript_4216/g.5834  ORF Transcript_4216/g.5834 Transcript_4216/m.5834 type:complete len:102 (+) Transcript_4216:89-394(+)
MASKKLSKDLRKIVKYFNQLPSSSTFASFLKKQYKADSLLTNSETAKKKQDLFHDYALLIESVKEQKRLRDIYAGELMTQEERIRKSAHRVGLQVPNDAVS